MPGLEQKSDATQHFKRIIFSLCGKKTVKGEREGRGQRGGCLAQSPGPCVSRAADGGLWVPEPRSVCERAADGLWQMEKSRALAHGVVQWEKEEPGTIPAFLPWKICRGQRGVNFCR